MKVITATEMARNLRGVIDRINETGEEYIVERDRRPVARVSPTPGQLDAEQAMADLYRRLVPEAAETWQEDARKSSDALSDELRDPWNP